MGKCQFCGYSIDMRGCLGTQTKYKGSLTHKGCLEKHLIKTRR